MGYTLPGKSPVLFKRHASPQQAEVLQVTLWNKSYTCWIFIHAPAQPPEWRDERGKTSQGIVTLLDKLVGKESAEQACRDRHQPRHNIKYPPLKGERRETWTHTHTHSASPLTEALRVQENMDQDLALNQASSNVYKNMAWSCMAPVSEASWGRVVLARQANSLRPSQFLCLFGSALSHGLRFPYDGGLQLPSFPSQLSHCSGVVGVEAEQYHGTLGWRMSHLLKI